MNAGIPTRVVLRTTSVPAVPSDHRHCVSVQGPDSVRGQSPFCRGQSPLWGQQTAARDASLGNSGTFTQQRCKGTTRVFKFLLLLPVRHLSSVYLLTPPRSPALAAALTKQPQGASQLVCGPRVQRSHTSYLNLKVPACPLNFLCSGANEGFHPKAELRAILNAWP